MKLELRKLKLPVMIHGSMLYRCKDCGSKVIMYLETGVEDHGSHGRPHQPCPFAIICPHCGGFHMYDVSGYQPLKEIISIDSLPDGSRYFAYDNSGDEMACGRPREIQRKER